MRVIVFLVLCFLSEPLWAQSKKEEISQEFQNTLELVESKYFEIKFSIATPLNGTNIVTDSAQIIIKDNTATGYLPYYTAGYAFPMTGKKGIIFDNQMLNVSLKIKGRKYRKSIKFQFDIIGKNDSYKLQMDIQYDKTCYLFVSSIRRSPISYVGTIQKISRKL